MIQTNSSNKGPARRYTRRDGRYTLHDSRYTHDSRIAAKCDYIFEKGPDSGYHIRDSSYHIRDSSYHFRYRSYPPRDSNYPHI